MSPAEVVEAFGQCARALDEDGARELSIGWDAVGDAPRRLYKQASAGRWELRALGPAQVSGDRAVQQLTLYWPERRKTVGSVWAHLMQADGDWKLAGAQADIRVAGLFVGGLTPPVLTANDLPGSEAAEAWGEAYLDELAGDVLLSRDDVAAVWDAPILGHIPPFPSSEHTAPTLRGIDATHPALRAHARIRDALAAHPRLVFVSSVSSEGKSTLAANLAYARGLMGQRVVLADGDLRLPRVWRRWKVEAAPGLAECVDGLEVERAVHDTDVPGVSLLTAGRAPADPAPVLGRAGETLKALAATYDSVLVDGAPGIEFDDAFVLAEAFEAPIVVVVEVGKTRKTVLAELKARFDARGLVPVGLVLNRTPVDDTGALRAYARGEGVQMRVVGSRAFEAVHRAAVGLHFGRPGEPGRTEWVILHHGDEGFVQVGRSKVMSLAALLQGAEIAGPEAYGQQWRADQLTQAFATAVNKRIDAAAADGGAQKAEPAAAFAQIIQALVADAAAGKTPRRPDVPVTVDVHGEPVGPNKPVKVPDQVRESVVAAVEKVLGAKAASGATELTPEEIRAHGPELAGEVLGALLGAALPSEVSVGGEAGRKLKLDLDLASVFGALTKKTAPEDT